MGCAYFVKMKSFFAAAVLLTSFSAQATLYTCSYEYIANGAQVIVTRQNSGLNSDGSYVACTDALTACQKSVKDKKPAVKCKFFIKGVVKK